MLAPPPRPEGVEATLLLPRRLPPPLPSRLRSPPKPTKSGLKHSCSRAPGATMLPLPPRKPGPERPLLSGGRGDRFDSLKLPLPPPLPVLKPVPFPFKGVNFRARARVCVRQM